MTNSQKKPKQPYAIDPRLSNKWWRLTHLYKIKAKSGALVTFKPNNIQLKHLAERRSHRYNLILKARQHGMTTLYCIDDLDESLWVPGMTSAIIAHERDALVKIFLIVKRAFDNLPPELKPLTKADNANEYMFTHRFDGLPLDSNIYVALKIRSGTVQNLHITESAYIKNRQELIAGSKQAVPKTGRISEETTGNGYEEFYDNYMEALANPTIGDMDYKAYFYPWFDNPEYTLDGRIDELTEHEAKIKIQFSLTDGQLLWRRWKIKELRNQKEGLALTGEQLFKQEYPSTVLEAFQAASGNVFDLEQLSNEKGRPPLTPLDAYRYCHPDNWDYLSAQEQSDNNTLYQSFLSLTKLGVRFWHLPIPGKRYVVGVDPSDGVGGDRSGIDVWTEDVVDGHVQQCAQFYGQLRPDLGAQLTKLIAELYNGAFVGVENNMLSWVLFLKDIYDNLFTEVQIESKTQRRTMKYGFNTNTKTRDPMIDEFIQLWEEDGLEINSLITVQQMGTFVKKENGKREHADGKSDDALFGAFIALQMRKHKPKKGRTFAKKPAGL